MDYPIAFPNTVFVRFRTNLSGSSVSGAQVYYSFVQISPNSVSGDNSDNISIYFSETTNHRIEAIYLLAIGY